MANRFLPHFLAAALPPSDRVPDGELLRRFARERDSAAFELLVRRHARAVWTACRRILSVEADAEDAFQATFLVLARKAGSVRGGSAAGWLHRVAVTAALKARRRIGRYTSATAEQLAAIPAPLRDATHCDSAAIVQEELSHLPDRYRLPLLLCELEGLTHAEAATALDCPVGTVSSRLSRARGLLRKRLSRRGITGPTALTPMAGLPQRLIPQTTAAATGAAPILPAVSTLTQGVLSMMGFAKAKVAAVLMGIAGLVGFACLGGYAAWGQGDEPRENVAPVAVVAGQAGAPVKKFQGNWKVMSVEDEGAKTVPENGKNTTCTFTGNLIEGHDRDNWPTGAMTFTLSPEKSPKQVDCVAIDGPDKGTTKPGIYKLEGKRLTICLRVDKAMEKGRPTEFSAAKGSGQCLIELERAIEADQKQSMTADGLHRNLQPTQDLLHDG